MIVGWFEFYINHCSKYALVEKTSEEIKKIGDINKDGIIDTQDAIMIFKYCIGAITFSDEQMKIADVNKDGIVDTQDARRILLYSIGQGTI